MKETSIEPGWYTLSDAARYTGLSLKDITTAIWLGRVAVRTVRIASDRSGKKLIRREALDAWIEGKPPADAVLSRPVADELRAMRREMTALRCEMEKRSTQPPRWMKLATASKYSGLSVATLRQRLKEKCFVSRLVGRSRLVDRISLDAWIIGHLCA
jgi:hypothetical protein